MVPKRKKKKFRPFKKWRQLPPGVPQAIVSAIRLVRWTTRVRAVDPTGFLVSGEPRPLIVVLWHNRLLFTPSYIPRQHLQKAFALISPSRDGEYATAFARLFGLGTVRGSTRKGGTAGLFGLRSRLDEGHIIVLTVDGPRGPLYTVHPGAGALAQLSGAPVLPVGINAPSRWEFKSWDRTVVPRPFSTVELRVGPLLHIPRDSEGVDRGRACGMIHDALMQITDDRRAGERGPGPAVAH
ncbi:MAG: hypothetical protein A3K19_02905 [Lentisphaerae bacterium RIFOXYB12_FULL_65_16]|nr:MAG: hypothetical protein A3K18_19955 [Lentisphaerae bacterium RIFOXYA12_64_32]OGV92301.1 MAG: hypothetical protein A3K19_02905 [Lentisphaerae bacterium RIFOXYB12_FULL_65_16]